MKNVGKNGWKSQKNMFQYDNPRTHTAIEIGKNIYLCSSTSLNFFHSGGEKGDVSWRGMKHKHERISHIGTVEREREEVHYVQ